MGKRLRASVRRFVHERDFDRPMVARIRNKVFWSVAAIFSGIIVLTWVAWQFLPRS